MVVLGAILALILTARVVGARTWRIQPDGSGDAPTIQAGIDSCQSGDEVVLAPGTYTWTSQSGGYPDAAIAVLKPGSTLRGELGASSTIVDGENLGCIFRGQDVGDVRIEGLTIRCGIVPPWSYGAGGITLHGNSHLTIAQCVLFDNFGIWQGGAIFCSTAVVEGCEFVSNFVGGSHTPDTSGGAIYCDSAVVENCVFKDNFTRGDGASPGGALRLERGTVRNCLFEGNVASNFASSFGGAIYGGSVAIDSCVFRDNEARSTAGPSLGGAVYLAGSGSVITRSVFVRNRSSFDGGAIYSRVSAQIEQCTLLANFGWEQRTGGIVMNGGSIQQVILAYTTEGRACSGTPGPTWSCSNLYANASGDEICGVDGGGNLSVDPQFCALDPTTTVSVGLQQDSPCAPGNHPDGIPCGVIGAGPVTCESVLVHPRSWTTVKSLYR
jgi:predicted outer membrane repeat protein